MLALNNILTINDQAGQNIDDVKANSSLIFIPDITGFTRFVQSTDVKHSQHIISELLEVLIDSNHLGLDISELEGDAILFYKYAHVPSLEQILFQAKRMFQNFHNHLKKYTTADVCHCGAVNGPIDLSLKIIIHQGRLGFTKVKQYRKPYGLDMIVAHKLLKNSVEEKEYVLVSDSFNDEILAINNHRFNAGNFRMNKTFYENIGEVSYHHVSLKPFLENINKIEPGTLKCPMFVSR